MDNRTFNEKLPEFRNQLIALCKKYKIEIVSVLATSPSSIVSQMHFIDASDPKELAKYGLVPIEKDTSSILTN